MPNAQVNKQPLPRYQGRPLLPEVQKLRHRHETMTLPFFVKEIKVDQNGVWVQRQRTIDFLVGHPGITADDTCELVLQFFMQILRVAKSGPG